MRPQHINREIFIPPAGFARRLRELMDQRGLTQQQVGKAVGMSQAAVYAWLNGSIPGGGELYCLAKFFGKSMEWFLEDTPEKAVDLQEATKRGLLDLPADQLKSLVTHSGLSWDRFQELMNTGQFKGMVFDVGGQWVILPAESEKSSLTDVCQSGNLTDVKSVLPRLRERLKQVTRPRGKKAQLARVMGVPLSSISRWLSGEREPGGDTTLKLLHWVEQQEREQK